MKKIGVLAHSAEGAALCFLTICHEGVARLGPHLHPEVVMSGVAMGVSMPSWRALDLPFIRGVFARSAEDLAACGCDFFVCPDNTAHLALEHIGDPLPLPGLHIAEVVSGEAKARQFTNLGLLGTNWTMEGDVYPSAFERSGLSWKIPPHDDRLIIDSIIFDELCNGRINGADRAEFVRIIGDLKSEGCDAVVLGCTEIPLLVTSQDSPLPTLDSTRLLAKAAVEVALGDRPTPRWFANGPFSETALQQ